MIVIGVAAAFAAAVLTGWARATARQRGMLDIPNHRSSHSEPVPRGGGIAIVAVFLGGLLLLAAGMTVPVPLIAALVPGGLAIALVGWLDDRKGLRPRVRASVHIAAATWSVLCLGGLTMLRFGSSYFQLGVAGSVLAVAGIVWFLNLFNFMDGIDGIASSQAVMIGLVAGAIALMNGDTALASVYMLLAGTSLGFMPWNWPPARIFMGDVGSGFLGYVLGVLSVAGERNGSVPLMLWIVLVAVFGFDATVTLIRRLLAGDQVHEAHRKHAYQRAVISGLSHRAVTLGALALTTVLGAASLLAARQPRMTGAVTIGALMVLSALYLLIERRQPMN